MSDGCKVCGQSWWVADPVTGECPGCRIAALEAERDRLRAAIKVEVGALDFHYDMCDALDCPNCATYLNLCAALEEGGDDE